MNPQAYQNAYDTAVDELTRISETFEQLRARKTLIENAVHALQPFFAASEEAAPEEAEPQVAAAAETESEAVLAEDAAAEPEPSEAFTFENVPSPLPSISETQGDPFQRRAKSNYRFKGFAVQRSF